MSVHGVTAIVPTYNSARWLPRTLSAIDRALSAVPNSEVLVVNDGSTDTTGAVLEDLRASLRTPLRVIDQNNLGRFLARWNGASDARFSQLLFVDSRVIIGEDALSYIESAEDRPDRSWIAHIDTMTDGLIGRFWEVPTYVFWGRYLRNPKPTILTPENFDQYPKGTTCLLVDRDQFLRACRAAWPADGEKLVSDDTRVLRKLVEMLPMRLDPGFRAHYEPRVRLKDFLAHSYDRGTLFVDSYAGTSTPRNAALLALGLAPLVAVLATLAGVLFGIWAVAVGVGVVALIGVAGLVLTASINRCPPRAIAGFLVYLAPFGLVFWAGLVRGLVLHRRLFRLDPATR